MSLKYDNLLAIYLFIYFFKDYPENQDLMDLVDHF